MNIRKAVITAAGRGQRAIPLQSFVDRDGVEKTALRIVLEEVAAAGIDDIGLVITPGDASAYRTAAGPLADRVQFIEQAEPRGYGFALGLAREFVGNEPFLHLVSDHLYLSAGTQRCAQQVVEAARANRCSVSAVQATRENMLPFYGTIGGRRVPRQPGLYVIEDVLEKPTPSVAEQRLVIPGLRAGHYLCFFGIHVFTPAVMELLGAIEVEPAQLSPVLAELARRERYLAIEVQGRRYNIGIRYGLLIAQLALALDGRDRENVLAQLVELLALRHGGREGGEE
jgi:UTP--glucose-1-phosphate uridylyltransferase